MIAASAVVPLLLSAPALALLLLPVGGGGLPGLLTIMLSGGGA